MKKLLLILGALLICCVSCNKSQNQVSLCEVTVFCEETLGEGLSGHPEVLRLFSEEVKSDVKKNLDFTLVNKDLNGIYDKTFNIYDGSSRNRYRLENVESITEDYVPYVDFNQDGKIIGMSFFNICDFIDVNESSTRAEVERALKERFGDIFDFDKYNKFNIWKSTDTRYLCGWFCEHSGIASPRGIEISVEDKNIISFYNGGIPYNEEKDYSFNLTQSEIDEVVSEKLTEICLDMGYTYVSHEKNKSYLTQLDGKKSLIYSGVSLGFNRNSSDERTYYTLVDIVVSEK